MQARSTTGWGEASSPALQSSLEVEKLRTRWCLSAVPRMLANSRSQARVWSWLRCPRNGSSQKGFVPTVAMDYRACPAPKLPPSSVAWSECHKGIHSGECQGGCLARRAKAAWAKLAVSVGPWGCEKETKAEDLAQHRGTWWIVYDLLWNFFLFLKVRRVGPRLPHQSIKCCGLDGSPWDWDNSSCSQQIHTSTKWVQTKS